MVLITRQGRESLKRKKRYKEGERCHEEEMAKDEDIIGCHVSDGRMYEE